MTKIKKWFASLLVLSLCLSLLSVPAAAYGRIDTTAPVKLTLNFFDGNTPLANMAMRIYKVFTMTSAAKIEIADDFKDYANVDLSKIVDAYNDGTITQADWVAMASTLSALIAVDKTMTPTQAESTDAKGKVVFGENDDLTAGIYLVTGSSIVIGGGTYSPQTNFIALPNLDAEEDAWLYDFEITRSKHSYTPPSTGTTVSRNVLKVWEDTDMEEERPQLVTVQLLRNGSVYSQVDLTAEKDWQHSWTNLDSYYNWQLVEINVPDDYTFLVTQTGSTFVVTNTYTTDIDDPDTPIGPGEPGEPGEPGDPGDPSDPDDPGVDIPDPDVPGGGLPETGTLWWPVQVLTLAGIFLFVAGWIDMRRGRKNRNEA